MGVFEVKNKTADSADLYIYGDIVSSECEKWSREDVCPADMVSILNDIKDVLQLNIHINSCGGNVFAGFAIYNQLIRHKAKKTVYVDGLAASIASVIAMCGDTIIMPANSYLMIHKPFTLTIGNSTELRKTADELDMFEKSIIDVYMKRAADDTTVETLTDLVAAETWLTASEASHLFNNIIIEQENAAAACISDLKMKNIPVGVKITAKSQLIKPDETGDEGKTNNNILLENIKNFIFLEEETADE